MDVRVEAGPLTAGAVIVESKTIVEIRLDVVIMSPIVSRFSLAPVISVGGNSISAINPEFSLGGLKATA
jgi:UDP-N-acetylglucosamine enolpyruvyl transferase